MSRIIKFRAWARRSDDWEDEGEKRKFVMIGSDSLAFEEYAPLEDLLKNEDDDFYLMQYTGLLDKFGAQIYEGDIVRMLYTDWPSNTNPNISLEDYKKSISQIMVVDFVAGSFCLNYVDKYGAGNASIHHGQHGEIEVIGNIYENPELLS